MASSLTPQHLAAAVAVFAALCVLLHIFRRACDREIERLRAAHAEELERILAAHREQQHHTAAMLSAVQSQLRFAQQDQAQRERIITTPKNDPIAWFKRQQQAEIEAERMRASMGPDSYLLAGAPMIARSSTQTVQGDGP